MKKIVITDECVGCGMCESVCPVSAISLAKDKSKYEINEDCVQCMTCVSQCPVSAIIVEEGKK